MNIKKKWNELDKQKKILVGIGSAVAVAAVGTGAVALATNEPDQPAQTKVADSDLSKTNSKVTKDSDKKAEKKDGTLTSQDEVSATDTESTTDSKKDSADETKQETVTKEDGTKVTVSKSASKTPTATVKVEKGSGSTSSNSSSTTSTSVAKPTPAPQPAPTPQPTPKPAPAPQPAPAPAPAPQPDPAPTTSSMLSAAQAKSVLSGVGLFKTSANGSEFYWVDETGVQGIRVVVGSDHVKYIDWDSTPYASRNTSKAELISILGDDEGTKTYEYGQNIRRQIESMVRAAANSVYGSGTAKANSLYSQIIGSGDRTFSF